MLSLGMLVRCALTFIGVFVVHRLVPAHPAADLLLTWLVVDRLDKEFVRKLPPPPLPPTPR